MCLPHPLNRVVRGTRELLPLTRNRQVIRTTPTLHRQMIINTEGVTMGNLLLLRTRLREVRPLRLIAAGATTDTPSRNYKSTTNWCGQRPKCYQKSIILMENSQKRTASKRLTSYIGFFHLFWNTLLSIFLYHFHKNHSFFIKFCCFHPA